MDLERLTFALYVLRNAHISGPGRRTISAEHHNKAVTSAREASTGKKKVEADSVDFVVEAFRRMKI